MGSTLRLQKDTVRFLYKVGFAFFVVAALIVIATLYVRAHSFAVFSPAGIIASREKRLIIITLLLSLIVVIPVFGLLIGFAWRYRESNTKATYSPNLAGNRWAETVWWLIPVALIVVLSVITWQSTHELDPTKPIASSTKPLTIQVVALQWKWLFIYPEQHIASVNFLQFPANTPLNFEITADAPMNSFWIPRLGGQIYAMSGMSTSLQLEASKVGDYRGVSANISGKGFASMDFTARASTNESFDDWVAAVRSSPQQLDVAAYNKLSKPSDKAVISSYATASDGLYDTVVMKYMTPGMMTSSGDLVGITGSQDSVSSL